MNIIQDYLDYRVYLKEYFDEIRKKKACYSYRRISQILNIDPGSLVKILQGKRHISERMIPVFAAFLGLGEQEKAYFLSLVHYNKAKKDSKKISHFDNLLKLKK